VKPRQAGGRRRRLAQGAVAAFVALTVDVRWGGILTAFERRHVTQPPTARPILHWTTQLGKRKVAGPLLLLAAVASRTDGGPLLKPAVRFVVTVGGRALVARVVHRPRPPRTWWQETPSGFSFPSRHTTWVGLAADVRVSSLPAGIRPWARVGEVAAVGAVGVSRVRLGVHWPTDVVGALLWGECSRRGALWIENRIAAKEEATQ
jgi:membrane-associated phospholipid phosphatase